jgi:ABC-type nitrate/sulfonate/bicarbonate transport system ATPase subunit/ABC-type proline/glycine betaine transport system permease subunit
VSAIRFEEVFLKFPGASHPAVNGCTCEVEAGELVVILGPSGCGKTTLLKMVNRLYEPTSGTIYLDGTDIRKMKVTKLRQQIGYVIQQSGLFPHMTVAENIAVVPKLLGWSRTQYQPRIDELLTLIELPPQDYRNRYPSQLSGGQQQRVGLARALAGDPKVMLMDEPFGAIDAITRETLQNEILRLQRQLKKIGMSYIVEKSWDCFGLLLEHLQMTGLAVLIAVAIALPLALLVTHYRWLSVPVLGFLGTLYTVPSLALIILLVPIFGLNRQSVVVAMIIYTQVILVRSFSVGLQSIEPAILEAASGMGMNLWQRWWRVQVPLILPICLAGVRLATIVAIAIAAIGAKFGAGGLGHCYLMAFPNLETMKIWAGAIVVAVLGVRN